MPVPREAEISSPAAGESSSVIRERVAQARKLQVARQGKPNALLGTREIDRHCGTSMLAAEHIAEAIQYRRLDASF